MFAALALVLAVAVQSDQRQNNDLRTNLCGTVTQVDWRDAEVVVTMDVKKARTFAPYSKTPHAFTATGTVYKPDSLWTVTLKPASLLGRRFTPDKLKPGLIVDVQGTSAGDPCVETCRLDGDYLGTMAPARVGTTSYGTAAPPGWNAHPLTLDDCAWLAG